MDRHVDLPVRITLVTNIPAPYRIKVYEEIKKSVLTVVFCSRKESNRSWRLPSFSFNHAFLRERVKAKSDGFNFIHNNPDVWGLLNRLKPQVVVTTGFNPTHLYAFIWAKLSGARHVCMTDGTVQSEAKLSWRHKLIRSIVFAGSHAFVAASRSGMDLYLSYGIPTRRIFQSQLCANNELFFKVTISDNRPFDVMYAGQFIEQKLPFLFVDTCRELVKRRGGCRALLIGDGPLLVEVLRQLQAASVEFHYGGFVQQEDLPAHYSQAKVLLFTTRMDVWGVVANEALAAGTPVITTPQAGVAGELVVDGVTGAVCVPNSIIWCNAVERLLNDSHYWMSCSIAGRQLVESYTYQAAADGIEAACAYAMNKG